MRKRWIPFTVLCLVLGFICGLQSGSAAETNQQQIRQNLQARTQTKIAVVIADTGTSVDGEKKNYSAAIVDTLGDDYVLVSATMADTGYVNGSYGAVITFPSDVSAKILSFNSQHPEKVQLEIQVNSNLSEKDYLATYTKILDLQLSINTTLAYTYVSSIYLQFHLAQDNVGEIFKNDLSDLAALDTVKLEDFTAKLALDQVPEIPLEPNPAETSAYFLNVTDFAQNVANLYLDSYHNASANYREMRRGLFTMTDNFPKQEDDWLNQISDWADISVIYGDRVRRYADSVQLHEDRLVEWYLKNESWHKALTEYQSDLYSWHKSLNTWFGDAGDWYEKYQEYLNAAVAYLQEVADYRYSLDDSIEPFLGDLKAWKELMDEYAGKLSDFFAEMLTSAADSDLQAEMANFYCAALEKWRNELEEYKEGVINAGEELAERRADLLDWQSELANSQEMIIDLQTDINGLSPIPDLEDYPDDPEAYLAAMTLWQSEWEDLWGAILDFSALPSVRDEVDWPDLPDLTKEAPGFEETVEAPKPLELPAWPEELSPVAPLYEGTLIPDELDLKLADPGVEIPAKPALGPLANYEGAGTPDPVGEQRYSIATPPENPLVSPPPRPDDFWASLNSLQSQLSGFEVDEYLTDEIKQQVALMLQSYENYLGTVREDLSRQFDLNIGKMHDVYADYNSYLNNIRTDALQAEASENDKLLSTLKEYAKIKEGNSEDTKRRLEEFSNMMRESRTPAGLNRDLVSYTVAPFEFTSPALRPMIALANFTGRNLAEEYQAYLLIGITVTLGVLLLTLLSYAVTYLRRKQRQSW